MQARFDVFILALALAISTLFAAAPARAHDSEAIAGIIRALDKQWVAAIAARDTAAVANLYTPDGLFMAPGAPAAQGREAIAKAWGGLFGLKNLSLTFTPTRIDVASRGDMAADIGAYELTFDTDQGRVEDTGKYVIVWRKVNGAWKAAADIFNTNLPAQ